MLASLFSGSLPGLPCWRSRHFPLWMACNGGFLPGGSLRRGSWDDGKILFEERLDHAHGIHQRIYGALAEHRVDSRGMSLNQDRAVPCSCWWVVSGPAYHKLSSAPL